MDAIGLVDALNQPNVRPFLWMIRKGEGTQAEHGYRTMFGGGLFDSFEDHPRRPVTRNGLTSTAAGAYQFLARTWDGLVKQYGFKDFTPDNQDLGCVALIAGRGALGDVIAGRFEAAVLKCNKEWASLPGSPYGQPVVTMATARREYEAAGGTYVEAPQQPLVHLGPEPIASITPRKEPAMGPLFIPLAIEALTAIVPKLGEIFAGESPTAQRNVKAAAIVLNAAKEAVGAKNEQELVDSITSDPQAADAVRKAIASVWFELQEVGGGIQAARAANGEATKQGELSKNPAFLLTLLLLPLVYFVVARVLYGDFSSDVQSMVIAAVISGVLGALTGFWLGTSFSSQRKTDILAK